MGESITEIITYQLRLEMSFMAMNHKLLRVDSFVSLDKIKARSLSKVKKRLSSNFYWLSINLEVKNDLYTLSTPKGYHKLEITFILTLNISLWIFSLEAFSCSAATLPFVRMHCAKANY